MKRTGHENLNRGGTIGNKGGGRPPDWLKAKCQSIVQKGKLVEFLGDVANGKDFEQGIGQEGEVIKIPASIKDRLKATEILLERGFGKVAQPLTGEEGGPIEYKIVNYGNNAPA